MAEQAVRPRRARVGRAVLRRLPLVGTMLGLGLGVWLVLTNDLGAVGTAFSRIGWLGLAGIVLMRAAIVCLCGLAWACTLEGLARVEAAAFLILRFVREGINTLLPVASVGGEVVGGRLLTFWGVGGAFAAASILVDMLIQVGTQIAFTLTGAALLRRIEGEAAASLALWTWNAAGIALVLLIAFFVVQRMGAVRLAERGLTTLKRQFSRHLAVSTDGPSPGPPRSSRDPAAGVQAALDAVWGRGRASRLAQATLLHLAAWAIGSAEIALALACIGVEVTFSEVIVLESLAQAIRSAAFPVPSGLGVQEGGFVVVGAVFGIDAGTALAVSLVKRVPDVVIGVPSLLVWQMLEARRATVLSSPD